MYGVKKATKSYVYSNSTDNYYLKVNGNDQSLGSYIGLNTKIDLSLYTPYYEGLDPCIQLKVESVNSGNDISQNLMMLYAKKR